MTYALAIHGGAGTISKGMLLPEQENEYLLALQHALDLGNAVLSKGNAAIDAVQTAVMALEDHPLFNAGKGSVYTHQKTHEMDASIMDGHTLGAGSVAGVKNIKNPILLARKIMDHAEFVMLSGEGAMAFALENQIPVEPDAYFHTEFRLSQLEKTMDSNGLVLDHTPDKKFGTVGAVALDVHGNLASATSTGGLVNKRFGRIGDTPIIGAGTYAENQVCAVSCTGYGEYFIRSVVAHDIACLMKYKGLSLKEACNDVVLNKLPLLGGEGGLIAVDAQGNIELLFNTEGMYRGSVSSVHPIGSVAIYK